MSDHRYIAFDLGTYTGVAIDAKSGDVITTRLSLPRGVTNGARLAWFMARVEKLLDEDSLSAVFFEQPIPTSRSRTGNSLAHQLSGIVEMVCHKLGLPCFSVAIASAKKIATGRGNASKIDIREAVAHEFDCVTDDTTQDECDALAVLMWAHEYAEIE